MKLHVLFSDQPQVVLQELREDMEVKDVKIEIQKQVPALRRLFLRLIFSGRVLDDGWTLKQAAITDGGFLHCASSSIEPIVGKTGQEPQIVPSTGFDRLRESGFSEDEIQGIRSQFHEEVTEDEEGATRMRQREEDWMNSVVSQAQPEENSDAAIYTEMIYGLTLGFLFGILMLFSLKQNVFTSRQQTGIMIGVIVNFSFGLLRWTS